MPIVINTSTDKWILTACISLHQCLKSLSILNQPNEKNKTNEARKPLTENACCLKFDPRGRYKKKPVSRNGVVFFFARAEYKPFDSIKTLTFRSWDRFKCRCFFLLLNINKHHLKTALFFIFIYFYRFRSLFRPIRKKTLNVSERVLYFLICKLKCKHLKVQQIFSALP